VLIAVRNSATFAASGHLYFCPDRGVGRVLNLHVGGRVIRTTAEHPFWVYNEGWKAAGVARRSAVTKNCWIRRPTVDHGLLNTPLAHLPPALPRIQNDLLDRVADAVRSVLPEVSPPQGQE